MNMKTPPAFSLEFRKYFMDFDTGYGKLDADGFEIALKARMSVVTFVFLYKALSGGWDFHW